MSVPSVFNNENFTIPENFDTGYGDQVTNLLVSFCANALSKAGGNFQLTADVNFGTLFGLLAKYFETISANPAQSGVVRLANGDFIAWRNADNSADIVLGLDGDTISINGDDLVTVNGFQTVNNKNITATPSVITDSTYTFQLTDANGKFMLFDSASAQTVIIPDVSLTNFDVGTEIPMSQNGVGAVTIIAGGTVTLETPYTSGKLRQQYSSASIVKVGTNTWRIVGDMFNG